MVLTVACVVVQLYAVVVLLRLLVSWFSIPPTGLLAGLNKGLWAATEPVLVPIRSAVKPVQLGSTPVDLSPFLFLVALLLLTSLICR